MLMIIFRPWPLGDGLGPWPELEPEPEPEPELEPEINVLSQGLR